MTTTSTYPKRVIAAALYDTLRDAVEKFGGIGAGVFYDDPATAEVPRCIVGFVHYLGLTNLDGLDLLQSGLASIGTQAARALFGIGWAANDTAVAAINYGLGIAPTPTSPQWPRVPFDAWVKYFNIQREAVLPAKAYDALKASSEKHGGIGADSFDKETWPLGYDDNSTYVPYCVAGHAALIDSGVDTVPRATQPTLVALQKAFGLAWPDEVYGVNDTAVHAINRRKGPDAYEGARVTFEEWTAELNVVRGAE